MDWNGLWRNARDPVVATTRLVAAAVIASFFVITLMVAATQTDVARRLAVLAPEAGHPTLEFTAATEEIEQVDNKEAELDKRRGSLASLQQVVGKDSAAEIAVHDAFSSAIEPLVRLLDELPPAGDRCDLPKPGGITVQTALAITDQAIMCGKRGALGQDVAADVAAVGGARAAVDRAADEDMRRLDALNADKARLPELQRSLDVQATAVQAAEDKVQLLRQALEPADALRDLHWPGATSLLRVPPATVQILCAFIAGLFGAMLVILVLIVYPNNDFGLASSGKAFGERVLLGGLVGICVLIILSSGVSVLGANVSFADGHANYLAFSAVAILGGMFSDRVTRWLSGRADLFYTKEGAAGAAAAKPGFGAPPAPALPSPGQKV